MADHPLPWSLGALISGADRLPLARWWLAAPSDALSILWQSEVGEISRHLILHPYPRSGPAASDHADVVAQLQQQFVLHGDSALGRDSSTACFLALLLLASDHSDVLALTPVVQAWLHDWWQPHRAVFQQQQRDLPPAEQFHASPITIEALVDNLARCNAIRRRANLLLIDPDDVATAAALRQDRLLLFRLLWQTDEQQLESLCSRPSCRLATVYRSLLHCGLRLLTFEPEERNVIRAFLPSVVVSENGLTSLMRPEQLPSLLAQLLFVNSTLLYDCVQSIVSPLWFQPLIDNFFQPPTSLQPQLAASVVPSPASVVADPPAPASSTISLDLGCGHNLRNPYHATRVVGVDATVKSETILNQWVGFQPLAVSDSSVDYVTAYNFLQFLPRFVLVEGAVYNPFIRAMNDIWRVLRPNGLFYAQTPAYPHAIPSADPACLNVITEETVAFFARRNSDVSGRGEESTLILGRQHGFMGHFLLLNQAWVGSSLCWELRCEKPSQE